jgi:hypothetical protein
MIYLFETGSLNDSENYSPAARKWLIDFIDLLEDQVYIVSYNRYPYFPKGKIVSNSNGDLVTDHQGKLISYLNIPLFREWSKYFSLVQFFLNNDIKSDDVIIFYNLHLSYQLFIKYLRKKLPNIKLILIIADPIRISNIKKAEKNISGTIIFSGYLYENLNLENKLLFEGYVKG